MLREISLENAEKYLSQITRLGHGKCSRCGSLVRIEERNLEFVIRCDCRFRIAFAYRDYAKEELKLKEEIRTEKIRKEQIRMNKRIGLFMRQERE